MTHREVAAMSPLQNLTSWNLEIGEQDNSAGKHFQMICQKVNNMIQPSQNFQFVLGDFMEMMELLNADLKHLFILNIRGLNIQLKRMRLFVSAVAYVGKEGLHKEAIYEVGLQCATKNCLLLL